MMSSREKILGAIKRSQPPQCPLPGLDSFLQDNAHALQQYTEVLTSIGGTAHIVNGYTEIKEIVMQEYNDARCIVSLIPELPGVGTEAAYHDPHDLAMADLAILPATIGVAENGAVWITEEILPQRVLPFITQHLAVVIKREHIVPTMHHAYEKIGSADYGFGIFIAGPSKTADIEQSLVLGAHGATSMRIFIL